MGWARKTRFGAAARALAIACLIGILASNGGAFGQSSQETLAPKENVLTAFVKNIVFQLKNYRKPILPKKETQTS